MYPVDQDLDKPVNIFMKNSSVWETNWKDLIKEIRRYYESQNFLELFKGDTVDWLSKLNANFTFFLRVLIEKKSYLLDDVCLLVCAIFCITLKDNQQELTLIQDAQKWRVMSHFSQFSRVKMRTAGIAMRASKNFQITAAEIEILNACGWILPRKHSSDILDVLFKRMDILSRGRLKAKLDLAFAQAKNELMTLIELGRDSGFSSACELLDKCIERVGLDADLARAAYGAIEESM